MADRLGLKAFVSQWKQTGAALQVVQDEELRQADPQQELQILSPLFDESIRNSSPEMLTGLFEWQVGMAKWKLLLDKKALMAS